MPKSKHTTVIDGIEYKLVVRDESTGYFGSWFCCDCHVGGVKYDLLPEVRDALVQAERGAIAHHDAEHPPTDGK